LLIAVTSRVSLVGLLGRLDWQTLTQISDKLITVTEDNPKITSASCIFFCHGTFELNSSSIHCGYTKCGMLTQKPPRTKKGRDGEFPTFSAAIGLLP